MSRSTDFSYSSCSGLPPLCPIVDFGDFRHRLRFVRRRRARRHGQASERSHRCDQHADRPPGRRVFLSGAERRNVHGHRGDERLPHAAPARQHAGGGHAARHPGDARNRRHLRGGHGRGTARGARNHQRHHRQRGHAQGSDRTAAERPQSAGAAGARTRRDSALQGQRRHRHPRQRIARHGLQHHHRRHRSQRIGRVEPDEQYLPAESRTASRNTRSPPATPPPSRAATRARR